MSHNVTKTINIFLAHFCFLKKLQIFSMLLGIMHAAPPLPKSPLISSYQRQNIWPKISVAYFTKWFQYMFSVGGWRMYPFNLPLLAPAYIPTQSCKRASFWSLNPAGARNYKPEPGSSPTFIFETDWGPKAKFTEGVKDMRNCGLKKRCVRVQLQVHGLSHPK